MTFQKNLTPIKRLALVKLNSFKSGKTIGKPRTSKSSINSFISTIEYMVSNKVGKKLGTKHTGYPIITFKNDLKKYYTLYNVHSYSELLTRLKEGTSC